MSISVMSWNVLSTSAYKHTLKHIEEGKIESKGEMNKRHNLIIKELKNNNCDIVLLQELDGFLEKKIKKKIKTHSLIFEKCVKNKSNRIFGCGILFKKSKFKNNLKKEKFNKLKNIIMSNDENLYNKKSAVFVNLYWKLNKEKIPVTIVSLHLDGKEKKARYKLFDDILNFLKNKKIKIIGGDFNCSENKNKNKKANCFYEDKYNKNIYKIIYPFTTCKFDYVKEHGLKNKTQSIDKIIVSNNFNILNKKTQVNSKKICKDFVSNKNNENNDSIAVKKIVDNYGSDHFWIKTELEYKNIKRKTKKRKTKNKKTKKKKNKKTFFKSIKSIKLIN